MSTAPALRLRFRFRRTKWLLAALLILAPVLAPIEAPDLPAPLGDLVGAPPASAQSTIFDGTLSNCPADPTDTRSWAVNPTDNSLCELSVPACREHPLESDTYLDLSTEFLSFCEATVLESANAAKYQSCIALMGYVIKTTGTAPDRQCRMILPARCPAGLNHVKHDTCISVQRRSWSCPADALPRNQFNSCYQPSPDGTGTNPACVSDAPTFLIMTCEEYVAEDFERNPTTSEAACSGFDTGASPALNNHSNQHWCRYDASLLDVACHGASPSCQSSDAYCLKRESRTGGCNVVADTLRCRFLQADYLAGSVTAEDVDQEGCTPCVVLPFSATSSRCPNELTATPSLPAPSLLNGFNPVHANKTDTSTRTHICSDPPQGRLVWKFGGNSQVAVVNSPVILDVIEISTKARVIDTYWWHPTARQVMKRSTPYRHYEYPISLATDPVVRPWPTIDETRTYGSVSSMMLDQGGSCTIKDLPYFRLVVQELWPDDDQSTIEDLFGGDSVNWWTNLTADEKKRKTEARGLRLIDGTDVPQDDAERARRATALTQPLSCNYGSSVWCRWLPKRSGYYRLVAAGVWPMQIAGSTVRWRNSLSRTQINNWLRDNVASSDNTCPSNLSIFDRPKDLDCIMEDLVQMGYTHSDGTANPAAAGMLLTTGGGLRLLPASDDDWPYTVAAGENLKCDPRDLRVSCGSTGGAWNYTETEPIGIMVQEIRVGSVTSSR